MSASNKQVHWFMTACLAGALLSLSGCASEQRKAEENARMQREAAQEVRRICALPAAEREAELEKVRRESDIVVFCGSE